MKKLYTKKEVQELLQKQIHQCANNIWIMNMVGIHREQYEKVCNTKLIKL